MLKLSENTLSKDAKHEISELLTEYHKRADAYRDIVAELKAIRMLEELGPELSIEELEPNMIEKIMVADTRRVEWGQIAAKIQAWYAVDDRKDITILYAGYLHAVTSELFAAIKVATIVDVNGC